MEKIASELKLEAEVGYLQSGIGFQRGGIKRHRKAGESRACLQPDKKCDDLDSRVDE